MPTSEMVVVGRIGSPYGVRGWSHLQSFTSPPENLISYAHWHLAPRASGPWRAVEDCQARPHKKAFVALLAAPADRDAAAALTGQFIGVPRESLPQPPADEYYWQDLVGMQVVDQTGRSLGRVNSLMETGAHDVLEIQPEAGEAILVPFTEPYLIQVDAPAGRIVVDWDPSW